MKSSLIREREKEAEALIAAGRIAEAIDACESIAGYYDAEETNCDQAGEYSDGMRASRSADEWRARSRELKGPKT